MCMNYARAAAMRGRNPANHQKEQNPSLYLQRIELGGDKQHHYHRSEGQPNLFVN